MSKLNFKISSGLKDLIGRDLITDDYIAVFELVKNSYDAFAQEVDIIFENIKTPNGKIIIKDNGKGMNLDDIKEKWLFVAYSAKKDNSEEDEEDQKSYRDKINIKKYYAGAKGIGRFSCDRLGQYLTLTTRKNKNDDYHSITINWSDFEEDPKNEFMDIKVDYSTKKEPPYKFNKGTVIEITGLRSNWDADKLRELKGKLSRLIAPTFVNKENEVNFKISITANEFKEEDKKNIQKSSKTDKDNSWKIINGEIKNFVFETLKLKTTHIICRVSERKNGVESTITTSLIDRKNEIYKIIEKNTYKNLENVNYHVFFLNQGAKNSFSRQMGLQPVEYGNIFIYKNGFRIPPYGDEEYDTLGLSTRKQQGYARFLGTRDLIGRIEIIGDNPGLKEKTSRDGGLIDTLTFQEFVKCFYDKVIKRLEKYIVDIREWGVHLDLEVFNEKSQFISLKESKKDNPDITEQVKSDLVKLITNLDPTKEKEIIKIDYNPNIIKLVDLNQGESSKKIINAFKKIAGQSNDLKSLGELEKLEKKIERLEKAKTETELDLEATTELYEEENKKLRIKNKKIEEEKEIIDKKLKLELEKNIYLRQSKNSDLSIEAQSLIHSIKLTAINISESIDHLYDEIVEKYKKDHFLLDSLSKIKFQAEKALKISNIINFSNFKDEKEEQTVDVVKYIEEYLKIYKLVKDKIDEGNSIKFIINTNNSTFEKKINILEFSIILDNLVSNSKKAGAKKIFITINNPTKKSLNIIFADDGEGLPSIFLKNPEKIFDLGVTTTDGSGIGLNSVRSALKNINGTIKYVSSSANFSGACFEIHMEL